MDNMLEIASDLASRAPAPRQVKSLRDTGASDLGHHVAAAVIGAVVLAEITMNRQRTITLQVEPQVTLEVTDAPA